MRIVVAVGGNALLRRGEAVDTAVQRRNVAAAARALAPLLRAHEVILTHGNGPQIGMLALDQARLADHAPIPLDVLGAESQGMLGYLIEEGLQAELGDQAIAALLTRVIVDASDPAFEVPTKPIGPVYDEQTARDLAAAHNWAVVRDGDAFRRAVPSPEPRHIVEVDAIRALLRERTVVICAGGGGIPVVAEGSLLRGVEAVIDKDLTSALLARELDEDLLLMLTDVTAVEHAWRSPAAQRYRAATPLSLRSEDFERGTMAPKVEAACRFVEQTGKRAAIGLIDDAAALVRGTAGTSVVPEGITPVSFWEA